MRTVALLAALLTASVVATGEGGVTVPWEEIKSLYRASVEQELRKELALPEKQAQIHSIEEARYTLTVGSEDTRGEAAFSGRVVSGGPEPILLLGPDAVVTDLRDVTGGTVLCGTDGQGMCLLPDAGAREFRLAVCFLMRPREGSEGIQAVSVGIPPSLKNSLELSLPPGFQLAELPGVPDADGIYHFAAAPRLTVKYYDRQGGGTSALTEIDMVSLISVQKRRLLISTCCVPVRFARDTLLLQAPQGSEFVASSLKASQIRPLDGGRYELGMPPGAKEPFTVEFALELTADGGQASFLLPTIADNCGQQGRFAVEEPDDGQVTVAAAGLVSQIPVEKLGEALGKHVQHAHFYSAVPADTPVDLAVKRFQAVRTPATVLDSQYLFASFEENGGILSLFAVDIPPGFGPRMTLRAPADSEIWSLTVNGVRKDVYAGEAGEDLWVVPLDAGEVSHVELAFLRSGPKLGLQGKLEAIVPETGLPSRNLCVAVALPVRVELLFAEGPVNTASGEGWKLPPEFVGAPHFFSRSFYKGEGMKLAISYREPVKGGQDSKGGAQ